MLDSQEESGKAFLAGAVRHALLSAQFLRHCGQQIPKEQNVFRFCPAEFRKIPFPSAAGDDDWTTLVRWVLFALIQAEEYGVTSANVRALQKETTDPELRWFLNESGQRVKHSG